MLRKTLTDLAVRTLASRPLSTVMQPVRSACIPVFMLHRIQDDRRGVRGHPIDVIEDALKFIKTHHYQPISIEQLFRSLHDGSDIPERAVAFTMDDGFYEQAELALPLFEKYETPITLFLATDMMDVNHWSWDYRLEYVVKETLLPSVDIILAEQPFSMSFHSPETKRHFVRKAREFLKKKPFHIAEREVEHLAKALKVTVPVHAPKAYEALQWEQARKMESKFVQFGPHTCTHTVLSQLDGESAHYEIKQSWERIQEELSRPCPVFCYPTGRPQTDFGEREKRLVRNLGLMGALSAEPGYVERDNGKNDLYSLRRFSFPNDLTQFKQYCSWVERAKDILLSRR